MHTEQFELPLPEPPNEQTHMTTPPPQANCPQLVVMDGTSMLFRAFYGMGEIYAPDGTNIGGIYGMIRMIEDVLHNHHTPHFVVVFDISRDTFRREIDPNYKANRKPPPPALLPQIPLAHQLVQVLGLPMYFEHGFEADDLMATLSQLARDAHMPCRLLSIDKDLCQLVSDQTPPTQLFDPYKLRLYNEAGVRDRMGVPPSHIIDFQALVGDSTDNVPGVTGVGPKTAIALINAFGHLEDIYNQLDQVETLAVRGAKSLAKKLEKSREDAFMSRKLVALRKDVPMPLNSDDLATSLTWNGTTEEAEHFFGKLGLYYPRRRWERLSYR